MKLTALVISAVTIFFAFNDESVAAENPPIVVIGATARSAPEIIQQALDQDRRVTGLARSPDRIEIAHDNFKAVAGDVYDVDSIANALNGDEVVIYLVGPSYAPGKEVTSVDLYSVGTASVITAMRRQGNTRLIVTSSGGVEMIPAEKPKTDGFLENFLWLKRGLYQDMQRMERIVENSDLEYVILRPRGFQDAPKKNNLLISDGIPTPNPTSVLSYADFATLVLSLTKGDRYLNRAIGVYTDEFGIPD